MHEGTRIVRQLFPRPRSSSHEGPQYFSTVLLDTTQHNSLVTFTFLVSIHLAIHPFVPFRKLDSAPPHGHMARPSNSETP